MTEMFTLLDPPDSPAHDSMVEKKSEFIGDACHVDSLEDALAFVESIREQHPKSRHVAYAAICGGADGRLSERMSDDGEPSGTAGKPILDVLRANGLTDCVVAVTRYFGGILLGSGGLIRAYSTGASLAVKAATRARIVPCRVYRVRGVCADRLVPADCGGGWRGAGEPGVRRPCRHRGIGADGPRGGVRNPRARSLQRSRGPRSGRHPQPPRPAVTRPTPPSPGRCPPGLCLPGRCLPGL